MDGAWPRWRTSTRARLPNTPGLGFITVTLAQQRAQVAHGPQVLQLVRVDDRAHGLDLLLRDVEDRHADQPALAVEEQRAWLAVDLLAARGDAAEAGERAQPRSAGGPPWRARGSHVRRRVPCRRRRRGRRRRGPAVPRGLGDRPPRRPRRSGSRAPPAARA